MSANIGDLQFIEQDWTILGLNGLNLVSRPFEGHGTDI